MMILMPGLEVVLIWNGVWVQKQNYFIGKDFGSLSKLQYTFHSPGLVVAGVCESRLREELLLDQARAGEPTENI